MKTTPTAKAVLSADELLCGMEAPRSLRPELVWDVNHLHGCRS